MTKRRAFPETEANIELVFEYLMEASETKLCDDVEMVAVDLETDDEHVPQSSFRR